MEKSIYMLKNIDINRLGTDSPLEDWYCRMVRKTIDELNIPDVLRMIRQDIFSEIAIPLAWNMLAKNPLAGEMYSGQLLQLLTQYLIKYPNKWTAMDYVAFRDNLDLKALEPFWDTEEEKTDFENTVNKLDELLKTDKELYQI